GHGADASIPGHLRTPRLPHPTRTRDGQRKGIGDDGTRHSGQRQDSARTPVTRIRLLLMWPALVAALAGQSQPPPPQTPFRAGVDLVSLNVTVADGAARYVTDLTAEDFNVFEDGVKQEVTFFNHTNLPIALALLIDTSASMEPK